MNNKLNKVLFVSTIALFVIMLVQTLFHPIPMKELKGETNPVEVQFNFENYNTNIFQQQVNDYLNIHFCFREFLIRLYNQYVWDCYHKTENEGVFFGKDNWLFFYEHLLDQYESLTYKYANSGEEMTAIFERDAKLTYYLQEILKEYGTTLFVGIAPSKNELFPEYLPENPGLNRPGGVWSDQFYPQKFDELGVHFIDFNAIFKSLKGKVDYPLFTKAGSHYSVIAATYLGDTLLKYMEATSGLNLLNVEYDEPYYDKATDIDRDMENLLNLIRPLEHADYMYVNARAIPDNTATHPRWLSIGDSFFWNLIGGLPHKEIFCETPYWYYNKEVYFDPNHHYTDEVDLVEELIKSDFVLLYWCPINLYCLEHGFLIKSLISLCYEDEYEQKVKSNIINTIKNNPEWYASVVQKSKEDKISIEEALDQNAGYTMREHYEEYFPEIFGDAVPIIRNSRIKGLVSAKQKTQQINK